MKRKAQTAGLNALVLFLLALLTLGCSGGSPIAPVSLKTQGENAAAGSHDGPVMDRHLWGIWDVAINKGSGEYDIVPIRQCDFHFNALKFLEPPPLSLLTIDGGTLVVDKPNNWVEVDVILTHPFQDAKVLAGFDVRGIVFLPGTCQPFTDSTLIVSGPGEARVLNPDGWTRWWNPKDFPGTGIFGFQKGLIGKSGGAGVFTATVNPYKYFADGLGVSDSLAVLPHEKRGSFGPGSSNRRHYRISFGDNPDDWLRFQYAVDASWLPPTEVVAPVIPDDFIIQSNAVEGCGIEVSEKENTLWWLAGLGMGGSLKLSIDVYSWRIDEIKHVRIDAPGITGTPSEAQVVTGSGGDPEGASFSTYTADITPTALTSSGVKDLLVSVETAGTYDQNGLVTFFGPPSARVSNYFVTQTNVDYIPPLHLEVLTKTLLQTQPATTAADFSVVGSGDYEGVYFFGDDYKLMRYPIHYQTNAEIATILAGFFGYTELELYGAPSAVGRFDLCPFGQFVASSISAASSPTWIGGLKRDLAFLFNSVYSQSGQVPIQVVAPDASQGYFQLIDVCANWSPTVEGAKIYWIQIDDPVETTPPNEDFTVILGMYKYQFSGNQFTGDIDYISASLVPMGAGDGKVDTQCLTRFAMDGDPEGVYGSTDLIAWFLETSPPALECFSIVSGDDSGLLNDPLCTIHQFHGAPRDIAVLPAHMGGYDAYNWVVVLEEGTGTWSVECFNQDGIKAVTLIDRPGYPANIDVDQQNYEIHVWYTVEPGGELSAAVLKLGIG
jgi:hypothetical protein